MRKLAAFQRNDFDYLSKSLLNYLNVLFGKFNKWRLKNPEPKTKGIVLCGLQ